MVNHPLSKYIKINVCILLLLLIPALIFSQKNFQKYSQYISQAILAFDENKQLPTSIRFEENQQPTVDLFFNEFNNHFSLGSDYEFLSVQVFIDKLGQIHHRYNQYYKGIQIIGAQYILHEKNGLIHYANGHLINNLNIEVIPVLSGEEALNAAMDFIGADAYMWENEENEAFIKREQNGCFATV